MKDTEIYDNINYFSENSVEIDESVVSINNSVEIDPAEITNDSVEIESDIVASDKDKAWYILPIIIKEENLYNKKHIKNIETVDMQDLFLIKVTYTARPFNYDVESCYHTDYDSKDGYVVVYKAPKDKDYICRMVAKSGHKVLTKDMLMTYFVK